MIERSFSRGGGEDLGEKELASVGECFTELPIGELEGGFAFCCAERVRERDEVALEHNEVTKSKAIRRCGRVAQSGERRRPEGGQLVECSGEHVHLRRVDGVVWDAAGVGFQGQHAGGRFHRGEIPAVPQRVLVHGVGPWVKRLAVREAGQQFRHAEAELRKYGVAAAKVGCIGDEEPGCAADGQAPRTLERGPSARDGCDDSCWIVRASARSALTTSCGLAPSDRRVWTMACRSSSCCSRSAMVMDERRSECDGRGRRVVMSHSSRIRAADSSLTGDNTAASCG
eukprot:6173101-Pleurochrysis_carterae.AAC.1